MNPTYNKMKIMSNAWYLHRSLHMTFAAALRKAWADEKRRNIAAMIEGRNLAEEDAAAQAANPWRPIAVVAGYYGDANRYYGD